MAIVPTRFDHPDARKLSDLVQEEYRQRYNGSGDATPLAPALFDPPHGLFLVAYDGLGRPVATGGWRGRQAGEDGFADGDAEVKRMFVIAETRGQGLARRLLAHLEDDARRAGRRRMVLETGTMQPEAIALYESSGYALVPETEKFGHYRCHASSRCYVKAL